MSLIEEALRRIKEPIPGQQQPRPIPPRAASPSQQEDAALVHSWPVASAPRVSSPPSPTRGTQNNSVAIVAMTVLGLAAILLIGGIVWVLGRDVANRPAVAQQPSLPPPADASPADEEPTPPPSAVSRPPSTVPPHARGELVVSGVVEGLGEPYAVINGFIVGVGDRVEGAAVLAIGDGTVVVRRSDGSEATLGVPR